MIEIERIISTLIQFSSALFDVKNNVIVLYGIQIVKYITFIS